MPSGPAQPPATMSAIDASESTRRRRTVTFVVDGGTVLGLVFGVCLILTGIPQAGSCVLGTATGLASLSVGLRLGLPTSLVSGLTAVPVWLGILVTATVTGGHQQPTMAFLAFLPLLGGLLAGLIHGLLWAVLAAGSLAGLAVTGPWPDLVPADLRPAYDALILVLMVFAATVTVVAFLRNQARMRSALAGANDALRAEVAERRVAEKEARAASRAKTEFLALMSHEIRTPMNGVLGLTELLLQTDLSGRQREMLETVATSGRGLLGILNDLLDFSKIEAGRLVLSDEPFELDRILPEVVDLFRGLAASKGLALFLDVPGELPVLRGDPGALRQIVLNLVGNAVKFTDAGEIRVVARADRRDDGRRDVLLSVSDTGPGIPPDLVPSLFEPFRQIDDAVTRRAGGTGLGLAIVRRLARAMAGDVDVHSAPGAGSRFRVRVTLATASPEEIAEAESIAVASTIRAARPGRGAHVLVVEDNPVNQRVARGMLEALGHTVEVVADGARAVGAVTSGRYDVVLMDFHMPGMDGVAATKAIRSAEGVVADVPIVTLTADARSTSRSDMEQAGADAFLTKPVTRAGLVEVLERVSARRNGSWVPVPEKDTGS